MISLFVCLTGHSPFHIPYSKHTKGPDGLDLVQLPEPYIKSLWKAEANQVNRFANQLSSKSSEQFCC